MTIKIPHNSVPNIDHLPAGDIIGWLVFYKGKSNDIMWRDSEKDVEFVKDHLFSAHWKFMALRTEDYEKLVVSTYDDIPL